MKIPRLDHACNYNLAQRRQFTYACGISASIKYLVLGTTTPHITKNHITRTYYGIIKTQQKSYKK